MATRRKYKETAPVEAEVTIIPAEAAPASSPAPASASPPGGSPLIAQLAAQRHAEELQRQRAQQPAQPEPVTLEQHIGRMPISEHKKTFLRQHPEMLRTELAPVMAKHYTEGLRSGLQDDSTELDQHILDNVAREVDQLRALTSVTDANRQDYEHDRASKWVDRQIEQEQERQRAQMTNAQKELLEAQQRRASAPPPSIKRNIPMSAPVSRDVPTAGGQSSSRTTLSAEERDVAHRSYRHMTPQQAEWTYAQQKKRLAAMRADGSYPMPERN